LRIEAVGLDEPRREFVERGGVYRVVLQ